MVKIVKITVLTAAISLLLAGCAPAAGPAESVPVAETAEEPDKDSEEPKPDKISEEPEPEETDAEPETVAEMLDPKEEFLGRIAGVWGTDQNYFEYYVGDSIKRGWFESDVLPDAHIAKVTKISEDKYEVHVEDDSYIDDGGGFDYEGHDYTAIYDGSADGFATLFIISNENGRGVFLRMGDDMDEAFSYYAGDFYDDYEELADSRGVKGSSDSPVGKWYTEGYDEFENWAMSYIIELREDGTASCNGWRNKDSGYYEEKGPGKALITFDHCECDFPGEGWVPIDGYKYTVEMNFDGDDATIKINAPDTMSNLTDGRMYR
ncbi:MAG: hypothetical protein K6G58_05040 [Lachnospiraceae bacterium]|nr:hypothetical protein [Lachnospiraceae bacterium]